MLDPFPLRNPPIVKALGQLIADHTGLKTLPDHLHEVLIAASIYQFTMSFVSPFVSNLIVPQQYAKLSRRTRMNWDIHFVALIQSILICGLSYYTLYHENERPKMEWQERVYGYTGGLGLVQAFTVGYFVWDLYICVRWYSMFGFGMLAHAISALTVYSLGFVCNLLQSYEMTLIFWNRNRLSTTTQQHSFFTSSPLLSSTSTGSVISSDGRVAPSSSSTALYFSLHLPAAVWYTEHMEPIPSGAIFSPWFVLLV